MRPLVSGPPVFSLNCLTNMPMLTPWAPRAGPTGGAGVAVPPGHWSFTTAVICFAILHTLIQTNHRGTEAQRRHDREAANRWLKDGLSAFVLPHSRFFLLGVSVPLWLVLGFKPCPPAS